ncbi:MAG: nitronate monooxygenase [Actinobacteria bacterium]|nr:nitronate monooxygenase [Actinomycetota bacterium]
MIHTILTDGLGLRYPIISAPMAGAADGVLAAAVSRAGGLGMIGIGSQAQPDFLLQQAALARSAGPFGIGLMIWALDDRPELFEAALSARPDLLSISFGDPTPYVAKCHETGIRVATQVHSRDEAIQAQLAGVDLIVAQGSEAGGHTSSVGTLPLLQIVLKTVTVPVIAAGGIASAEGVAGVLAAGAAGAWIGTAFLASPETLHSHDARERIRSARETETILTHVFDRVQNINWPEIYPGRALRNTFSEEWHGHDDDVTPSSDAGKTFHAQRGNYAIDFLYAGQAVGLVDDSNSAESVVKGLGEGAEQLLRHRLGTLLDPM